MPDRFEKSLGTGGSVDGVLEDAVTKVLRVEGNEEGNIHQRRYEVIAGHPSLLSASGLAAIIRAQRTANTSLRFN